MANVGLGFSSRAAYTHIERYTPAMNGVRWKGVGLAVAGVAALVAIGMWLIPPGRWAILAAGIVAACATAAIAIWRSGRDGGFTEPGAIEQIDHQRCTELIRGTSMHLREMRYRYSVRSDRTDAGGRKPFTAEVNTINLGFLPVILTDNETDFQGYGYLAFVYDGRRWRGPGLPCPDGREAAMTHARRNVKPANGK